MGVVEWTDEDVRVSPVSRCAGTAGLPGSKSLTNRLLICAALADGRSLLRGASLADDAYAMLNGLEALGVATEVHAERRAIMLHGSRGHLPADEARLQVGHAGTAMRFLTALCAVGTGRYVVDGSPRMRQRPIQALVDGLRALGAQIGYADADGFPPVNVLGRGLTGGEAVFDTPPSSQFVSALLMVAPYAQRDVLLRIDGTLPSRPYVDMTIDVMHRLGVEVISGDDARFIVPAFQRYRGGEYDVEPDASAATYFWAAAAITGGEIRVAGLTRASRQGDARFVDVLEQMGCAVEATADSLTVRGPADGRLRGVDVDLNAMPDTVQTLAVCALFADGPTNVRNVANLRVKETDRIAALAAELTKLGARVAPREDGLHIEPPTEVRPARIATYDDHRMAMSFALAGLRADGLVIADAGCVSKSFPDFFESLAAVAQA